MENVVERIKKTYNGIDVAKFIMAIVVVSKHTQVLINCENIVINKIYEIFFNMVVPFFFMASGYLMVIKLEYPYNSEESLNKIKTYIIKFIKMYVIWSIIYMPLSIYGYILDGTSASVSIIRYIKDFLLVGEHYNSWTLWYLLSMIYGLIFIWICFRKKISPKVMVIFSIIISLISWAFTYLVNYQESLPTIMAILQKFIRETILNGRILNGAVYIPIGIYLANNKIPNLWNWCILVIGIILTYIIKNSLVTRYLIMITVASLFGIIKEINLKNSIIYPFFRNMSTVIYFIHMYVWTIYCLVRYGYMTYGVEIFGITAIWSVIISFIYVYIKNEMKIRKLAYK